jgi:hypothetical protein
MGDNALAEQVHLAGRNLAQNITPLADRAKAKGGARSIVLPPPPHNHEYCYDYRYSYTFSVPELCVSPPFPQLADLGSPVAANPLTVVFM